MIGILAGTALGGVSAGPVGCAGPGWMLAVYKFVPEPITMIGVGSGAVALVSYIRRRIRGTSDGAGKGAADKE